MRSELRRSKLPPTVAWTGHSIRIIDQRELPHHLEILELTSWQEAAEAIRDMAVRGAPAIGCCAALATVLIVRSVAGCPEPDAWDEIVRCADILRRVRPTAVNLTYAVSRVLEAVKHVSPAERATVAEKVALAMLEEDVEVNRAIGRYGAELLPNDCQVLTHCNAGALATVGFGTALGVVRAAYAAGKLRHVYADETRPRLQGLQLTAWELMEDGIPVTVIPDGSAAWLMKQRTIHAVVVGADRVASNGDAANKIGTYSLAIVARRHSVPFYVAAPTSSFDWTIRTGDEIPIEERSAREITHVGDVPLAPEGVSVWNPAFDVTPAELISGIITEFGVYEASAEALRSVKLLSYKGVRDGAEGEAPHS